MRKSNAGAPAFRVCGSPEEEAARLNVPLKQAAQTRPPKRKDGTEQPHASNIVTFSPVQGASTGNADADACINLAITKAMKRSAPIMREILREELAHLFSFHLAS